MLLLLNAGVCCRFLELKERDCCVQILELLCPGLAYTSQRNARTDGSHPLLRPDATYGQPPIVFVEEKAEAGALKQAERELHQKIVRIP